MNRLNIAIFCLWLSLIGFLLYQDYSGAEIKGTEALKSLIQKENYWYDIYVGPKKVGFANIKREKVGNEIIITDERERKIQEDVQERIIVESFKCISDLRYSIKSFEYSSNFKNEKGTRIIGNVDAQEIIFLIESPNKRRTFKSSTQGKVFYLPSTFVQALSEMSPTPGSVFSLPILDLKDLVIKETRVIMEEIRPLKVGIDIKSLYKFRAGNVVFWSNESGVLIKEENPTGVTLYSQLEKIAKDTSDRVLFDYTSLPFIKSNRLIGNPEKLNHLRIKLRGMKLDAALYRDSRLVLENDILTITKEDKEAIKNKTYRLPYTGSKLDRYLKPDEWVSSDYEPLYDTGIVYAKNNQYDAFRFADYLTGYLYTLVRTRPLFVLQSGKDFLYSLYGDYLERTVMFPSYARAAGLPTRLVGGMIYEQGYFHFHTWPEIWIDKWVPIDPTFAQFPADVSHIPLKEGTLKDITSIIDELRLIEIEILEAL